MRSGIVQNAKESLVASLLVTKARGRKPKKHGGLVPMENGPEPSQPKTLILAIGILSSGREFFMDHSGGINNAFLFYKFT